MENLYPVILNLCQTFLITELFCSLIPEEKALKWCINIVTVYIILSLLINMGSIDFNFEYKLEDIRTEESIDNLYLSESEKALSQNMKGVLESVYIEVDDVEPVLEINEEGTVALKSLCVRLKYKSDIERARAVIRNVFEYSKEFEIEVIAVE